MLAALLALVPFAAWPSLLAPRAELGPRRQLVGTATATLNATNQTCGSPTLPDEVAIVSTKCSWEMDGAVKLGNGSTGEEVATFQDNCRAWNPSDLLFYSESDGSTFLTTHQQTFAVFGDVFELRDCNGEMFAWAKEQIFSWGGGRGVAYDIHLPPPEEGVFLRSRSGAFWDARMEFEIPWTGEQVGVAHMEWENRMAMGWFCNGGRFQVSFNATTSQVARSVRLRPGDPRRRAADVRVGSRVP